MIPALMLRKKLVTSVLNYERMRDTDSPPTGVAGAQHIQGQFCRFWGWKTSRGKSLVHIWWVSASENTLTCLGLGPNVFAVPPNMAPLHPREPYFWAPHAFPPSPSLTRSFIMFHLKR